jgi:hypothetical protein
MGKEKNHRYIPRINIIKSMSTGNKPIGFGGDETSFLVLQHHVDWTWADVSEQRTAPIFRAEEQVKRK